MKNRLRALTVIQTHRRSILAQRHTASCRKNLEKRRRAALKLLWAWRRKMLRRLSAHNGGELVQYEEGHLPGRAGEFAGACACLNLLLAQLDAEELQLKTRRDALAREFILLEADPERQLSHRTVSVVLHIQRWWRRKVAIRASEVQTSWLEVKRDAKRAQAAVGAMMIRFLRGREQYFLNRLDELDEDLQRFRVENSERSCQIQELKLQENVLDPDAEEVVFSEEVREQRRFMSRASAEVRVPMHLADFAGALRIATQSLPSTNGRIAARAEIVVAAPGESFAAAVNRGSVGSNNDSVSAGGTITLSAPMNRGLRQRVKLLVRKRRQLAHQRLAIELEVASTERSCLMWESSRGCVTEQLARVKDLTQKVCEPLSQEERDIFRAHCELAQHEGWDEERCCKDFAKALGMKELSLARSPLGHSPQPESPWRPEPSPGHSLMAGSWSMSALATSALGPRNGVSTTLGAASSADSLDDSTVSSSRIWSCRPRIWSCLPR